VRIFVSEFISSGALSGTLLPDSLLREGRAMLSALVGDLLALPGCQVTTTLDRRLNGTLDHRTDDSFHVDMIDNADAARIAFERSVTEADATLVIAPETDGILARLVQRVHDLGSIPLNCEPAAIDLCGDKLLLAGHLAASGIATIPTRPAPVDGGEPWELFGTACVIKPRDGAGSWLTFGIPFGDSSAWTRATRGFATAKACQRAILQPWIAGRALSVGCLCDDSGNVEIFPVADQHLSGNQFQYQGGRIPADIPTRSVAAIERLVRSACETIAGLRGYIGIDLLLPDADPTAPLIVEINPRLTTSYVGYRQLCDGNIAARLLGTAVRPALAKSSVGARSGLSNPAGINGSNPDESATTPLLWKSGSVCFQAGGECRNDPRPTTG
jgi:predicted ATP-grasp superfamily ATP-dependent carboligase